MSNVQCLLLFVGGAVLLRNSQNCWQFRVNYALCVIPIFQPKVKAKMRNLRKVRNFLLVFFNTTISISKFLVKMRKLRKMRKKKSV